MTSKNGRHRKHVLPAHEICCSFIFFLADLKHAVKEGNYYRVRKALNSKKQYNLEQPDNSGVTLVMIAAMQGEIQSLVISIVAIVFCGLFLKVEISKICDLL